MIDEVAIQKAEARWLGKQVYITRGYYTGHWGVIARAESETSFVIKGGTLSGLEPIVEREDFRGMRKTDFVKEGRVTMTKLIYKLLQELLYQTDRIGVTSSYMFRVGLLRRAEGVR